jgi:PKD repeat protein
MKRLVFAIAMLALSAGPLVATAGGAPGDDPQAEPPRYSMERVTVNGPADVERLSALGLDVTHDVHDGHAVVAAYSDAQRALLSANGFQYETAIYDLAAKSRDERQAEAAAEERSARSNLPSGRDTYRVYDDYVNEINQLAEENPEFVRKLTIGQTIEGRDIIGLEMAAEVHRTDDGRPAYVQLGEHHAREWPSGEFPMEFAIDLVDGFNSGNTRITNLLEDTRVFIFPVVNVDGFIVSRGAAISPVGGGGAAGFGIVAGANEYKRKNCRPGPGQDPNAPCASRPANSGIDLNRNYGYYWGGPGTSTSPTAETYRGAAPFSEPESQAVHEFSAGIHPTVLISNHTFTENGWWLRQPGFNGDFFPQGPTGDPVEPTGAITPDEPAMKALGDAMGDEGPPDNPALGATGWPSDLGWLLGDITGATEDWNYFSQGTYGYTPEARGSDFHSLYAAQVVQEYEGDPAHTGEGVREAFLLAGEEANDTDNHGVLVGTGPPGATLRLHKEFESTEHPARGNPPPTHPEVLDSTITVPADGTYEWHVMPSDRPQIPASPAPAGDEEWTMTCERPGQGTFGPVQVEVARGQQVSVDWGSPVCGTDPVVNVPPVAGFTVLPPAPVAGEEITFTSTSTDSDGAIETTEWDLDDDGMFDDATGPVATTTFPTAGNYEVAVRVTDDDGDSDVDTKVIQVAAAPPPNQAPVASFEFSPVNPAPGETVTFTSTSSDPDGTILTHEWDLDGDGNYDDGIGGQISRAYLVAGLYGIGVRVTDDRGAFAVSRGLLQVGNLGSGPGVTPPPTTGQQGGGAGSVRCRGLEATLTGTQGNDIMRGTESADVIAGLGGSDRIRSLGGDDVVCGGGEADRIALGTGDDTALGGPGRDRIGGGSGEDRCRGGRGRDILRSCE